MKELIIRISNLFKKYGIKSITMDDIAGELGISKKTLYQHFKNKIDIVYKISQFEFKKECLTLDNLTNSNSNAIKQLYSISKYIVKRNREFNSSVIYSMNKCYPQIWEKLVSQRKKYIHNLIERNFQLGIKQGFYRETINIEIIAVLYTFMLDIKVSNMLNEGLNNDYDKIFNTHFLYIIRGIANNEGIEYSEKQIQQKH